MSPTDRLVAYVAEHPACTPGEVRAALAIAPYKSLRLALQAGAARIRVVTRGRRHTFHPPLGDDVIALRKVNHGWQIGDIVVRTPSEALEVAARLLVRAQWPDLPASQVEDRAVDLLLGESP